MLVVVIFVFCFLFYFFKRKENYVRILFLYLIQKLMHHIYFARDFCKDTTNCLETPSLWNLWRVLHPWNHACVLFYKWKCDVFFYNYMLSLKKKWFLGMEELLHSDPKPPWSTCPHWEIWKVMVSMAKGCLSELHNANKPFAWSLTLLGFH